LDSSAYSGSATIIHDSTLFADYQAVWDYVSFP
jgi:hypothetical protein